MRLEIMHVYVHHACMSRLRCTRRRTTHSDSTASARSLHIVCSIDLLTAPPPKRVDSQDAALDSLEDYGKSKNIQICETLHPDGNDIMSVEVLPIEFASTPQPSTKEDIGIAQCDM